jgi:hypothetical protein
VVFADAAGRLILVLARRGQDVQMLAQSRCNRKTCAVATVTGGAGLALRAAAGARTLGWRPRSGGHDASESRVGGILDIINGVDKVPQIRRLLGPWPGFPGARVGVNMEPFATTS